MKKLLSLLPGVREKKLYYCLAGVVILVGIIGIGVSWAQNSRQQAAGEEIMMVRTMVVGSGKGEPTGYVYSGEVRGRYESQLAFQVSGKIVRRNVQLGSEVHSGDVLMQIDARDIQQVVNSSSAQVASAESQLRLAESNLNRYRQLLESGAISRAQYDQYASAYEVAAATARQASAQQAQGVNQLDYSVLRADKPGVVSSITAEMGQVVSAGQIVATVVQDGEREVEISVPENRIEELRKTGKVNVSFWALPDVVIPGSIREVAPMADQATRTFKVRVSLINPPPQIRLGMTAAVTVGGNPTAVVTIPMAAIYQDGDTSKVWVVQGEVLTLRSIQTGMLNNGTVQVTGGLQSGERIVSAGVHKLREGQKVKFGGDSL